ncbi:sister chromatid cohesion protein 1 [Coemansia sp. 'formosensis']|nr:sister chromatid cohesion protein 1 [Coemansia sp. 'formosensis']
MVAAHSAITLPEALTEFDILLPSPARLHGGVSGATADSMLELEMAAAAMNTSRIQDITLAEQSFDISMVARGMGEVNLGGEDLLGRDDDFRLDLDADFVFSPIPQQLPEPSMNVDESALEPEIGREAMQGLEEGVVGARAEDVSLLSKGIRGFNADGSMMDITHEDLGGGVDSGDMLRFGDVDDLAMQSALGDVSMVPDTQEAALQEAEAEVLAVGTHVARPGKRRRLNLSELITSEATSLSPDEIRSRLNDPTDIVRVPTYLPLSKSARLEDVGSAAVASRFLAADRDSPFTLLFAAGEFDAEQEVPTTTSFGELDTSAFGAIDEDAGVENLLGAEEFRLEDVEEEVDFGATVADRQHETELLLADKSVEQLERLEEESFQRQAEEQVHEGANLFADALPARDEDISMHVSQFVDSGAPGTRLAGAPQGGVEDALTSNAGYSKNTIRAIHILDAACAAEREGALSYQGVVGGARRGDAVKLFFELLVLKSKGFIDVQQAAPFEDILISPCAKLRQAADSISVATTDDASSALVAAA